MRIAAIDHYTPGRVVGREETSDLFRHYSAQFHDEAELERVVFTVNKVLDRAQFRQCIVRADGEHFYARFLEMARGVIEKAGLTPRDIGTVVYCGVGRGYREPATAYGMSAHLGCKKAECFDILDACNGWGRSTRVVNGLLRTGASEHILVLNLEFNRSPLLRASPDPTFGKFHAAYSIRSFDDIEWRVWAATVGEAGTATVFSRDDARDWYFDYDCECEEFEDCAFTLRNHREYDLKPMVLDHQHGGEEFFWAFGKRIGDSVKAHLPPLLRKVQGFMDEATVAVPHSLSSAVYEWVFNEVGIEHKAIYPFRTHGNCVSAGLPLGLSLAIREGRLKRGDRALLVPTGSGSSAGVISFVL
jgi:3-oxoacyl-[acyl-carrier-protein] synthase III